MISRSANHITSSSQRQSAMRRLQRRGRPTAPRLYCRTNGCTTTMQLDAQTGIAACPVCGARRRID
ncbi:MAG: hypothetical protein ACHQ15_03925 [Candidatus Limnocylindrales bacterium]